jgi:peptidoglycan hydrolase-like protein with peptidoglycan-binding domain
VTRSIPRPERPAPRILPAVAASALLGVVAVAGFAGRWTADDAGDAPPASVPATATSAPGPTSTAPTTAPPVPTPAATTAPGPARRSLASAVAKGSYGEDVRMVQQRLVDLGFAPGPVDGQFGTLTRAAVWAFEKLVLGTPRADATGVVTDAVWQRMQDPIEIGPRRSFGAYADHTEVYLPEQVVVFFVGDRPALISHMSSGTGEQWCDEVTISPGEMGNERGTTALRRGECGISNTPGGVYEYYRRVEGVRQSALGGMWNPVYFNYGIAIHGALDVPLEPASHGCIRIPLEISETFQQHVDDGDAVYVFDGEREPEAYGDQPPTFNWLDPDYRDAPAASPATSPATTPAR